MSEAAALPAYDPKATDEAIEEIRKAIQAASPERELWLFRHPKTQDWCLYAPASSPAWKTYKKLAAEQRARGEAGNEDIAYEHLAAACVLYPSADERIKLFARRPALLQTVAGEIVEVSGFTAEAVQKKL